MWWCWSTTSANNDEGEGDDNDGGDYEDDYITHKTAICDDDDRTDVFAGAMRILWVGNILEIWISDMPSTKVGIGAILAATRFTKGFSY